MAVRVLEALDAPDPVHLVLNVPNQGATPAFDAGTVVEVVGPDDVVRSLAGFDSELATALPAEARQPQGFGRGRRPLCLWPLVAHDARSDDG